MMSEIDDKIDSSKIFQFKNKLEEGELLEMVRRIIPLLEQEIINNSGTIIARLDLPVVYSKPKANLDVSELFKGFDQLPKILKSNQTRQPELRQQLFPLPKDLKNISARYNLQLKKYQAKSISKIRRVCSLVFVIITVLVSILENVHTIPFIDQNINWIIVLGLIELYISDSQIPFFDEDLILFSVVMNILFVELAEDSQTYPEVLVSDTTQDKIKKICIEHMQKSAKAS